MDGERSKKMRDRAQQNSRSNFFIALNSIFNDVLSDRLFLYIVKDLYLMIRNHGVQSVYFLINKVSEILLIIY